MRQSFNEKFHFQLEWILGNNSISSLEGKVNVFRIFTGSKARHQSIVTNKAPTTMNQEQTNGRQGAKNQEPTMEKTSRQVTCMRHFSSSAFFPTVSFFSRRMNSTLAFWALIDKKFEKCLLSGDECFLSVTLRIEPLFWRTSLTKSWCASPWKWIFN